VAIKVGAVASGDTIRILELLRSFTLSYIALLSSGEELEVRLETRSFK
jgi:hypothetical protein